VNRAALRDHDRQGLSTGSPRVCRRCRETQGEK
jgi:hypothetical protein